jgi:mevalonate kinase
VPCAVELRASVTVRRRESGLRVQAGDLTLEEFTVEYDGEESGRPDVDVPDTLVEAGMGYINEAVTQAKDATGVDCGFEIEIESEIPLGAGLGSSAAVAVATIDAATRELGVELSREELAERAYQVEYEVQNGEASRADTYCCTMGGAVRVEGDDCQPIEAPDLPFVIGYDGGAGDTGALVAGVRELRSEYDFAADTVSAIGDLVRRGEQALAAGDIAEVGKLMDFNHGLLSALGVSSRSLDAMVWAARDANALGAKLTGAGGGGCIVALDQTKETETALQFTPGCEETFRAGLSTTGVTHEAE